MSKSTKLFQKQIMILRSQGYSIVKAAVEASEQRLRPILMTVFSTIVGLFPLAIASGAGAAARQSLATAVIGGMIVATFLSLIIVPILYIVISSFSDRVAKYLPSPPTRHNSSKFPKSSRADLSSQ
ncbi:hypothetical protein C7B62_05825 [Pleurocapsa sp. CCALA 161]|uniref:efflux RND transporter permease subunit n=1 Tax=Pleurocapsa sp. CCALA 161 TaxID=2107688 RepID=UPI000D04D21E|nr:efflux RND transporter permease subunit [Pleurocapsa sp. CCALA 161]PSB11417.1 hypothetical protein C7B62_05825 [Pleurocapsa sp. CCALA 161]